MKKNVLIIINEHRKINTRSNLKVFELFSLKIEPRDQKVRGSRITELKEPKNLFNIVNDLFEIVELEIPNVIIRKVTRNTEGTKEKVRDSESLR